MMGRNHVVTGAASLVVLTGGAALLDRPSDSIIGNAIYEGVHSVVEFMMLGNEPFSLYGALCVALYFAGVLLPDADSSSSIIGRTLHTPFEHRTWLHSLWPVLLLALAGWFAFRPIMWLALGWFVHLFWDSLSRQGICWFYPLPGFIEYDSGAKVKRGHWVWLYRADSIAENVLAALSVGCAGVICWLVISAGLIPMGF